MIWAQPWGFYFAFAALAVAAIFLYRRRLEVVVVPSLQPYLSMNNPSSLRSWLHLLRRLLSLLMQLLIVALLVMALAQPMPAGRSLSRLILIMDVSYTMQTTEGAQTRLDLAKQLAMSRLAGLPAETEVVLVQAAHAPLLLSRPTQDREIARQKIELLKSWDVPANLADAVEFANSMATGTTELVVISDFQGGSPGLLRDTWKRGKMVLLAAGHEQPDAAVATVSYLDEEPTPLVQAQLLQKGMTGQTVTVSMMVNGQVVGRQQVALQEIATPVKFPVRLGSGDAYQVQLEAHDSLVVDDSACGVLSTLHLPVTLVTAGNVSLVQAIRSNPDYQLQVIRPDEPIPPGQEAIIVDRENPSNLSPDLARGFLFIGTTDPFGWATSDGWTAVSAITHWSEDHPILQDINPLGYRLARVIKLKWPSSWRHQEVLGSGSQEVMAELQPNWPGGHPPRCLYWPFFLDQTNLPGRASFPLLVANAVAYLSGHPPTSIGAHTGHPLQLTTAGLAPTVKNPDGQQVSPRSSGTGWILLETLRSGFYECRSAEGVSRLPVNLSSDQSVRPVPAGLDTPRRAEAPLGIWRRVDQYFHLSSRNLVLLCVIIMFFEWALFLRRVVVI